MIVTGKRAHLVSAQSEVASSSVSKVAPEMGILDYLPVCLDPPVEVRPIFDDFLSSVGLGGLARFFDSSY